jgi:hypothetical protein
MKCERQAFFPSYGSQPSCAVQGNGWIVIIRNASKVCSKITQLSIITCKKCGARVSDDSFCTNCGISAPGQKTPSETRQGAVVGALIGSLHGIASAILTYFVMFPLIMPLITKAIVSDRRVASDPRVVAMLPELIRLVNTIMYVSLGLAIPFGAILGCMLGYLFVKVKNHIPGSSIIRKSMVVSVIWIGVSSLGVVISLLEPRTTVFLGTSMLTLQMKSFASTIVLYLLLGWLFGYLLDRRLKSK